MERLGVAAETKQKMKLFATGTAALEAIARGDAEIGLEITSSASRSGIELAGSLPTELQSFNSYAIGIVARAKRPEIGKSLISFLTSKDAHEVLKKNGLELP